MRGTLKFFLEKKNNIFPRSTKFIVSLISYLLVNVPLRSYLFEQKIVSYFSDEIIFFQKL